jgi:hypothetical protein
MRLGIKRLGRIATVTAAIIAGSSLLEATGQPLLAVLSQVAFNLAAGFSEADGVRQKMSAALIVATNRRRKGIRLTRIESFGLFDAPQGPGGAELSDSTKSDNGNDPLFPGSDV